MFKKGIIYILLNYFIQFLNIVVSLLLMKYLTSYQLGSLSLAKTWQQLMDYSHLGTRFSLDRYLPTSEESERKYLVVSVVFSTFFVSIAVLLCAIFINKADLIITVISASGMCIAIGNILKAYYRATNKINEMLNLVFFNQVLPLLVSLVVYYLTHNLNYYLWSLLSLYVVFIVLLIYKERSLFDSISLYAIKKALKKIAFSSFLLFINSIFVFLYLVMDRFFIDYTNGRDQLGYYSVILFVFSALMVIPSTCAELLFVKIIKQSCTSGKKLFIKETLITAGVTLISIIFANISMGYFVEKYTSYYFLIDQIHIATFAVIPFAFTAIYYHVMNGLDLRKEIIVVNFGVCVLLVLYYFYPIAFNLNFSLDYYLYAKVATGWLVFLGYIFYIFFRKKISI